MNLASLVRDSARRAGGNLAVAGPDRSVTYDELDRAADTLAHLLRDKGVRGTERVVIWLDKSVVAVAAMQGALRLSAVYVPVDGSGPSLRTARIARGCSATVIVTDSRRAAELRASGEELPGLLVLDGLPETDGRPPLPVEQPGPDDLAYILYTSGSTGEPKGVCISQRNALAFIDWAAAEIGATSRDRFANHAPFGFDLSVLDLYVAFRAGASVHLIPSEMAYAPQQLCAFLRTERITVWYSVPSVLILMIRDGDLCEGARPPWLRVLLFAGEPFAVDYLALLHRYLEGVRLLNLYGPTETNVCTFHEVTAQDVAGGEPVPIGRACSGDEVWAVTPDGRRAAVGEEGELVVDGPTVMAGYWGRGAQEGPYRTGDVVRVRADGVFEYRGRLDHMVKVRGHRVELGEIEACLSRHPAVGEVAVLVDGNGMAARIVAAVVPVGPPPGLLALKRHCAERLPRYMIPDSVLTVAELPRTRNGKTDRQTLRDTLLQPSGSRT
ncbi:amino acid adenylation domain-containing protein [Streptomyces triticiradicis]|uniref:D-alanine--poly(Phosphoribitol) ligase n=1 Tax=Streptomyces triticiradicis TaxID=2651189 RepID=A0A7J5DHS2_9ACTN|nr:amino acid adenylation domain-containing protein [Streptomyces triticiradicis]KAB1988200.1 D-alanine--poly(phosphoribitol) ligase [Streptomyces triticiradicis]